MPIRFRCHYCNQLLGIARRKAGTAVQCPTCRGQVIVPVADAPGEAPPRPAPPVFEQSDFEAYLKNPLVEKQPAAAGTDPAPFPLQFPPPGGPSDFDVERLEEPPASPAGPVGGGGVVLSPTQATILTVAAIILLAVAFGLGLWVGRYLL